MAVDLYDIFSPCAILFPTSPTLTSLSSSKIHEWFIYRVYIVLSYLATVGTLIAQLYIFVFILDMPWTIFNKPTLLALHAILFTILLAQSVRGIKKDKLKKLIDSINEIDDVDYFVDGRKYKMYNAVFTIILLVYHVGCTIINNLSSVGVMMYAIPLSFVNIMLDVEILVLTNFVSILNVKMEHVALKLENIVKKKEASKEELYEPYRQGLYIVKRINNVWRGRVFAIIVFQLYFITMTMLKLFAREFSTYDVVSVFNVVSKFAITIRHVLIYSQLGLLGQWLAERFDRVSQLANTVSDMDLGDEVNHQAMKICHLSAVCPGRLCAASFVVDGQLPLKVVSAVISTVILMLQFGLSVNEY